MVFFKWLKKSFRVWSTLSSSGFHWVAELYSRNKCFYNTHCVFWYSATFAMYTSGLLFKRWPFRKFLSASFTKPRRFKHRTEKQWRASNVDTPLSCWRENTRLGDGLEILCWVHNHAWSQTLRSESSLLLLARSIFRRRRIWNAADCSETQTVARCGTSVYFCRLVVAKETDGGQQRF